MFGGHDNNGQMQDNTAAAPNDGLVSSSMAMPEPGGVGRFVGVLDERLIVGGLDHHHGRAEFVFRRLLQMAD